MKKVNIFFHSFQKVKPIYYIDSLHIESFEAFISWNSDDYDENSVSWIFHKIWILHNLNNYIILILHKIN